jgi:hypothetical protein
MKLTFGDPCMVTWEDACSSSGWNVPYKEGPTVINVGIFVQRNKNGICLAKGVVMDDPEEVLAPMYIPNKMVRKIRRLR